MKEIFNKLIVAGIVCALFAGCGQKTTEHRFVQGTIEGLLGDDSIPEAVAQVLKSVDNTPGDERFEAIMGDKDSDVSVWGLMKCNDQQSAQGYGITVIKGGVETDLLIRHGNQPKAYYDESSGKLWFSGAAIEGTGTLVERPYLITFDQQGKAVIEASIDPYEMQQALIERISYSIDGQEITLFANKKELTTATSTTKDMGGFLDDPIWIGEQITYMLGHQLTVCFVPGIDFVVGKVLIYDDMPTIAANVDLISNGNFRISDFRAIKED